jgi:transposase-like protein
MAKGNLVKFTAFQSEDEAIAMLESLRWPNGAACPHCGGADPYRLTARNVTPGKRAARPGLWKCRACRKQFTVKVGTIFESSHIPVSKWLSAIHLISASKKGMSALQFQRMLGMTYRSAWFMAMRLRHAMAEDGTFMLSGTVEVDETYVGGKRRAGNRKDGRTLLTGRPGPNDQKKVAVVALVERKGRAIAFPVERVDGRTLQTEIRARVRKSSHMMSDQLHAYDGLSMGFVGHDTVKHSAGEYVRENVHTNTVEGFFSLLKRGIVGTFHHVSKGHLHRYCDEFAFRYSDKNNLTVDGTCKGWNYDDVNTSNYGQRKNQP